VVVAAALLAVWWWGRPQRANAPSAMVGSATHERASHAAAHAADAGGRRIAGTVTLDGKPVEATVRLVGLAGQQRTTTDASGHFAFERVPIAEYVLIAERPETEGDSRVLDLRDPANVEELGLVLHACAFVVEGLVHDASSPIAHASVAEANDAKPGPAVESGDDGRYRLCVAPGDVELIVRADGYAHTRIDLAVYGRAHRDIELVPEAGISGRVVRAQDHTPVAGAIVEAQPERWQPGVQIRRVVTGDDGGFRITGEGPGRFLLTATADHLAVRNPVPVIAEVMAPVEGATIEMQPAAMVRGVVREAGKPVSGATVILAAERAFGISGDVEAVTRTDGTFAVDGLLPGDYYPAVTGYTVAKHAPIAVVHDDVGGVVLDVEQEATVAGRVTSRGAPVEGASVQGPGGSTTTDAAGRFLLVGLEPGTARIYAESKRLGSFTPGPEITIGAHEHKTGIEIELDRSASIAGTVVDQNGSPVGGAVVKLSLLHGKDFGTASTADDGTFVATELAGGGSYLYEVRANDDSSSVYPLLDRRSAAPIAVRDASTHVSGVRFRVRVDRLAISGRVTTAAGDPLPDVIVDAFGRQAAYQTQRAAAAITDASGAFTIRDLQAGMYEVTAHSPRGNASVTTTAGRSDAKLVISDAATVEAIVEGFSEPPDVWLFSREDNGSYRPFMSGDHALFRDVPPGKYRVRAISPTGDAQGDVTAVAGARVSTTVRRVGRGSVIGTFVSAAGTPIADANCQSSSNFGGTSTTDAAGAFRLEHVPAGSASVECATETSVENMIVNVPADGVASVKIVAATAAPQPKHPSGLTVEMQLGGALVTAVAPGSPADKAGLRVDDMLVSVWHIEVSRLGEFFETILEDLPAAGLPITYERGDQTGTVQLVPL